MLLASGGKRLRLRKFDKGAVILEDVQSKECRTITEGALLEGLFGGLVQLCNAQGELPHSLTRAEERGATQRAIAHASALLQWITALRQRGIRRISDTTYVRTEIQQLASNELAHLPRFEISTLYEAELRLRRAQEDAGVLVPAYAQRGGRGQMRIDIAARVILEQALKDRLEEEIARPLVVTELFQTVTTRIAEANREREAPLAPVSETTVRRFVKQHVDARQIATLRLGKKGAAKLFRSNSHTRDAAARPLEAAEFDDIDTGVFLISGKTGLPWGRAWMTNGVDQCTAHPLGYDVDVTPRSFASAIGAVCHALLPKTDLAPGEMGYGAPGIMLFDNASYNKSKSMKYVSVAERLLFARARPYGSTEKCVIEHFNHIVKSDFCPTLPGWRGDKTDREAIRKGQVSAVLTIEQFFSLYKHWLTKIYVNKPGDDGQTSKQRWLHYYDKFSPAVRYTPQQLEIMRMRAETRKFRASGGLLRLKLRYDSPELEKLREKLGHTAEVVVFVPRTLTYVKVLNPFTSELLHVPCSEKHHYVKTTTEYQHRLILKALRCRKNYSPTLADLVAGRNSLREMVQAFAKSNALRTRKISEIAGEVAQDVPSETPTQSNAPKRTKESLIVCTVLEAEIEELNSVELDEEEEWA